MRGRHLAAAGVVAAALVTTGAVFVWLGKGQNDRPVEGRVAPRNEAQTVWHERECPGALSRALREGGYGRTARCGHVEVPETNEKRRTLRLGVVRLLPEAQVERAPLLFLPGGPGDSLTPHLENRLRYLLPLAEGREVLIVDQRGTGASVPVLDCDKALRQRKDLERCYDDWRADLDPGAFATTESVGDLAATLDALQLQEVSIYGFSYGTRLALDFAEKHPKRIESLVVDSPMPRTLDLLAQSGNNALVTLRAVFSACAQQPDCLRNFPLTFDDLVRIVETMKGGKGAPDGDEFTQGLVRLMVTPAVLPLFPLLVSQAETGKFSLFYELREGFSGYEFSFGLHLSVQCAEQFPKSNADKISHGEREIPAALRPALSAGNYVEYCEAWKVPPREVSQHEVSSDLSVLILSGEFDPVTPLGYAKKVAQGLTNGRLLSLKAGSHGVGLTGCGARAVREFLTERASSWGEEGPSCVQQASSIQFVSEAPSPETVAEIVHQIRYRL